MSRSARQGQTPPGTLTERVRVPASQQETFAAAMDWERQDRWILATTVRLRSGDGRSVGSEVEAVTGVAGLGVTDPMRITEWDAPHRCVVRHTGRLIRGDGVFTVYPSGADAAVFEWTERLELPFGALGRLGWVLVRPLAAWGLRRSLHRFRALRASA